MISRNLSSPISLYLSLLVFSLPPPSHIFCLEITPFLYLEIQAHQWPRKLELLELPFWNGGPRYTATYPRRSEFGLQIRYSVGSLCYCEGLRRSVGRLAAAYQRQSLLHFCCFLCFGSFFIVSFLFYPDIVMSYKTL